jgi:putative ABC transport system permease protein
MPQWTRHLRALINRRRFERELEEELRFHVDRRREALEHEGAGADTADAAAQRALGGVLRTRERAGDVWGLATLDALMQDVRYGLRQLRRAPAFAAAAILTIGLAIGLLTSIFSIVRALLLSPLPVAEASRLVAPVMQKVGGAGYTNVAFPDHLDWRAERDVFDKVAVYTTQEVDVTVAGQPERINLALVSEDFLSAIGAEPVIGRVFRPEEHTPGMPPVALITSRLWEQRFGRRASVLDEPVRMAQTAYSIVGVLPASVRWPVDVDVWVPLRSTVADASTMPRDNFAFDAIARLAPGADVSQARARLRVIAARIERDHPVARRGWTTDLLPLRDAIVERPLRTGTLVLAGAVTLLLVLACLNVAGLLIARGEARGREIAVRVALGAGRRRLIRQLLVESACLGAIGGLLGLAIAVVGVRALAALAPAEVTAITDLRLDRSVLLASVAATVLASLVFGLTPALTATRGKIEDPLRSANRSTDAPRAARVRQGIVLVQVSTTVVLLVGAALLLTSLAKLNAADPGVRIDGVVAAHVALAGRTYKEPASRVPFYEQLLERLASHPGVVSVGAVSRLPVGGPGFQLGRVFLREGQAEPPASNDTPAEWVVATPGYFATLGVRLVEGRTFDARDTAESAPVIVVSETFARRAFNGRSPIGQRIRSWRDENKLREVIGVVRDVRYRGLADDLGSMVYVPHRQSPWLGMMVAVRTNGGSLAFVNTIREEVRRLDPNLAIGRVNTVERFAAASIAGRRFTTWLLAAFAGAAVVLAAVGIYGVTAFGVSRRARELGIRLALGATPGRLLGSVVMRGARATLVAALVGLVVAASLTSLLRSLLFEVTSTDWRALAAAPLGLLLVSLVATWLPARQALRRDPMKTLRAE